MKRRDFLKAVAGGAAAATVPALAAKPSGFDWVATFDEYTRFWDLQMRHYPSNIRWEMLVPESLLENRRMTISMFEARQEQILSRYVARVEGV